MAQLVLSVFVDGMMALLLILTIFYCWRLNLRIRVLQDSKSELAKIIKQFDESTQKATAGISAVHEATSRISENIQHKIDKANYLADDLQFMIEKGNKLVDRYEDGGGVARPSSTRQTSRRSGKGDEAIESKARRMDRDDVLNAAEGGDDSAPSSLESVLRRVSGRKSEPNNAANAEGGAGPRRKRAGARMRSKSEQELFEALKSGGTEA